MLILLAAIQHEDVLEAGMLVYRRHPTGRVTKNSGGGTIPPVAIEAALGMFMDVLSMMVLTIPVAVPVVTAVGVDPVWFGIFIVLMCELGLITPPVGMNLYVVQGVRPDAGPFSDVIKGAVPNAVLMLLFTLLLIVWPDLVLSLPRTMAPG